MEQLWCWSGHGHSEDRASADVPPPTPQLLQGRTCGVSRDGGRARALQRPPSSRRATNADEGRRHTLTSRTRHARRQHHSRAHACTPTQILRNTKHRSIDSHLQAYRLRTCSRSSE
ncbi:hypothetical protein EIQ01_11800 [Xanthomonas campestris pv. raphani]